MQNEIANELERLLDFAQSEFKTGEKTAWELKPAPLKWSKKEILGHLVDSAQNNLRRFVVSQYQENDKIVYQQDEWVKSQHYQQAAVEEIVLLWVLLNKQLARTLRQIPADKWEHTCDTGKGAQELHSLIFLADDYIKHLKHHLNQILQK